MKAGSSVLSRIKPDEEDPPQIHPCGEGEEGFLLHGVGGGQIPLAVGAFGLKEMLPFRFPGEEGDKLRPQQEMWASFVEVSRFPHWGQR